MDRVAARLRDEGVRWVRHAVPADGAAAWLVMLAALDVAALAVWMTDPAPAASLPLTIALGTIAYDVTVWLLSRDG